jgi:hypothetical protein
LEIDQESMKAEQLLIKDHNNNKGFRKMLDSADYEKANQKISSSNS